MNINEIFDYLATTELDGNWLVEDLREVDWEIYQDELMWVVDGENYSAELTYGMVNIDNLVFINADNDCGNKYTYILDKGNQMIVGSDYV